MTVSFNRRNYLTGRAIDKLYLVVSGCISAVCRDGLSTFFAAMLAKMARITAACCAGDVCATFDFTKLKVAVCSGDVVDSNVCLPRLVGSRRRPIVFARNG